MFKNNYLCAVLPHRGVAEGKSRLSSVLDQAQRIALNRWLIEHTLRVVINALGDAQQCLLVSPCANTLALARASGARVYCDNGASLNEALNAATREAASFGAQQVLIVPCDLPLLDATALDAVLALATTFSTVIAPDAHERGTNALLMQAATAAFAFGDGSFSRHMAQARTRGDTVAVSRHRALTFDLDTPEDYRAWHRDHAQAGAVSSSLP